MAYGRGYDIRTYLAALLVAELLLVAALRSLESLTQTAISVVAP
jgi:hypothetical protein